MRMRRRQRGGKTDQEEKDTYLLEAAVIDDPDKVADALDAGANVNTKDNDGRTSLILASRHGHTEIVTMLLANGADVNAKNNDGWTALIVASFYGHTEIVTMLLEKGADVNAKNNDGYTALIMASEREHMEIVIDLLANGADVNAKDDNDYTALDWAVEFGHTSVVELLEKAIKTEQETRSNKQNAMGLVRDRHEKVPSLQTLSHRNIDTHATMLYNKAATDGIVPAIGSKLGGKRKTRKYKKSKKSKRRQKKTTRRQRR